MRDLTTAVLVPAAIVCALGIRVPAAQSRPWRSAFTVAPGDLTDKGSQPYFILEPGYQSVFETGVERLVITVREVAPRVAMDRAEIVSVSETVRVPAGTFTGCLKMEETTPLEPGVKEYKYYARGVGLVMDGDLKLVRYGAAGPSSMRTW